MAAGAGAREHGNYASYALERLEAAERVYQEIASTALLPFKVGMLIASALAYAVLDVSAALDENTSAVRVVAGKVDKLTTEVRGR